MAGVVAIVGAGPGDPGLITVKGLRWLERADVIVYDRLAPRELLERARPGARLVYAGKEPGRHAMSQEEINRLLVEEARRGRTVVRLHGGDPLLYGRGEEECLHARRSGVECVIVPGVPSLLGAAAEHLIPVAGRLSGSTLAIATGVMAGGRPLPRGRVAFLARATDTVVLFMAARRLRDVLGELVEEGLGGLHVVVVERATRPGSRRICGTAQGLLRAGAEARSPALVVIGGAARWHIEHAAGGGGGAAGCYY